MRTLKEQLTGKCRHFNGAPAGIHDRETRTCKAGVNYRQLARIAELGDRGCWCRIPCTGDKPGTQVRGCTVEPCGKYSALTDAEIQARIDEINEETDLLMRNLSPCCKAPIDHNRAIPDGEHKSHGPRYCSKCKKLVFMV